LPDQHPQGYYKIQDTRYKIQDNIEFLGQVTDEELVELYKNAKGFLALAQDEDFGITPVESMICGTPVIAYNGGGYKETIVDGKTGVLFDEYSVEGLERAIKRFEALRLTSLAQGKRLFFNCIKQAKKFSKEKFIANIRRIVNNVS